MSSVILKTFQYAGDTYTVWTAQNTKGHYILIDSESTWNHEAKLIFAYDSYIRKRVIDGNSTTGTIIHGVSYKNNFEIHFVDENENVLHNETVYWS